MYSNEYSIIINVQYLTICNTQLHIVQVYEW